MPAGPFDTTGPVAEFGQGHTELTKQCGVSLLCRLRHPEGAKRPKEFSIRDLQALATLRVLCKKLLDYFREDMLSILIVTQNTCLEWLYRIIDIIL